MGPGAAWSGLDAPAASHSSGWSAYIVRAVTAPVIPAASLVLSTPLHSNPRSSFIFSFRSGSFQFTARLLPRSLAVSVCAPSPSSFALLARQLPRKLPHGEFGTFIFHSKVGPATPTQTPTRRVWYLYLPFERWPGNSHANSHTDSLVPLPSIRRFIELRVRRRLPRSERTTI